MTVIMMMIIMMMMMMMMMIRRAGSFTPPIPRAISNTINKICSREGSKSPTLKRKGIFR